MPDTSSLAHQRNARLAVLTSLLLLGACLRVLGMTQADIWFDEGFTYYALKVPDMFFALLRDTTTRRPTLPCLSYGRRLRGKVS